MIQCALASLMGNSHEFHNMSLFLWQWGVNCAVLPKALKERYGGLVYETTISKRIEAANSTAEQKSLISKKNSVLGGQYRELVTEILSKEAI